MALSGLDIYKLLPKTNCKACGFATCLAFAMQLAQKKVSLDKCPHVTEKVKDMLQSASEPPVRLITVGSGDKKIAVGNETVLFRHEEKFHHQTAIGFSLSQDMSADEIRSASSRINEMSFERVGQKIARDLVVFRGNGASSEEFKEKAVLAESLTGLPLCVLYDDADYLRPALDALKGKKPLIGPCTGKNHEKFSGLALEFSCPVLIVDPDLDKLAELSSKVSSLGVKDIVLSTGNKPISATLWDLTSVRRMALKRSFKPLGYPFMVLSGCDDPYEEAMFISTCLSKYASICVLNNTLSWEVLGVLTARQNIYTDPQKPLQVQPKIYNIGAVTAESPVILTTNFSLTYYTVESEVEASKKPCYVIACDADGMSVLTAWAADKFTAGTLSKVLAESGIKDIINHKTAIIPGYVASISAKLEDESGWKVVVGPREASGIPVFLRNLKV